MNKNTFTLVIAASLILFSFVGMLWRTIRNRQSLEPDRSAQVVTETKPKAATRPGDTKLSPFSISCGNDGCKLPIQIEVRKRCTFSGDIDLIRQDLELASDEQRVLLSVEPIDAAGASFKPITHTLTLAQLTMGESVPLTLPEWHGPIQLGLFLCKDARHEGRCAGKASVDLMNMLAEDWEGKRKDRNYRSPDRIYFFQYLFWSKAGTMEVTQPVKTMFLTSDVLDSRIEHVAAAFGPSEAKIAEADLRKAFKLTHILQSFPVEPHDSYLHLVLPSLDKDPVRCFRTRPKEAR